MFVEDDGVHRHVDARCQLFDLSGCPSPRTTSFYLSSPSLSYFFYLDVHLQYLCQMDQSLPQISPHPHAADRMRLWDY